MTGSADLEGQHGVILTSNVRFMEGIFGFLEHST